MTTNVDISAEVPPQRTPGPDLVPFGWERYPDELDLEEREAFFRFPAIGDPTPSTFRVLGMALYTALLGLGGVGVGLCGFVSVLGGDAPGWYVPALTLIGLIGVTLAVGAFLSIHRRFLPWGLLLLAGGPLVGDVLIAASY